MHLILNTHCHQGYFWGICVIIVLDAIKQWIVGLTLLIQDRDIKIFAEYS
jgi:hypothetical protein